MCVQNLRRPGGAGADGEVHVECLKQIRVAVLVVIDNGPDHRSHKTLHILVAR
ncbi:Uncharacterised protein [Mycobacteroides abscessus subsp. abscessus]|nr:Uncharacterised protein [Mycobacteroides abscessus subsp. abscessus]